MTEKRFTQKEEDDWEILENGKHFAYAHSGYQAKKIIQTLNELSDKLDCHILLTDQERQKASNFIKGIEKENEGLKKELKKYTDAFDCSQCRFQNYDWFDDGDEFEVCEKGNNEAQMENHSCSEWDEI